MGILRYGHPTTVRVSHLPSRHSGLHRRDAGNSCNHRNWSARSGGEIQWTPAFGENRGENCVHWSMDLPQGFLTIAVNSTFFFFSRMWISDIHIESKQDLDWRLAFNHPDTNLYHSSAVAAKSVADWMPSVNEHSPWKNIYHVYQSFSNWSKSRLPYCLLGLLTSWNNLVHGVLHTILIHTYIYIIIYIYTGPTDILEQFGPRGFTYYIDSHIYIYIIIYIYSIHYISSNNMIHIYNIYIYIHLHIKL